VVGVRAGGGEAWLIPADDRDMARCPRLDPYYRPRLKTHHARPLLNSISLWATSLPRPAQCRKESSRGPSPSRSLGLTQAGVKITVMRACNSRRGSERRGAVKPFWRSACPHPATPMGPIGSFCARTAARNVHAPSVSSGHVQARR
jgi:hypothetical protein